MALEVQACREMESKLIADIKNVNFIVELRKKIENEENSRDVRMASVHCLRRIFVHLIENNKVNLNGATNSSAEKANQWILSQYQAYQATLCSLACSTVEWMWELCIKTSLELVKAETNIGRPRSLSFSPYRHLLHALIHNNTDELDADVLLVLRNEAFCWHDCALVAWEVLFASATELKTALKGDIEANASQQSAIKNIIDVIRMIDLPMEDGTADQLWAALPSAAAALNDDSDDDNIDADDDSSVEDANATTKKGTNSNNKKRGREITKAATEASNKRRNTGDPARSLLAMQKIFSQAWIATLSLPMPIAQHKVLLRHLPEHVMPRLKNPLLLADYLTQSYNLGGGIAVLALESLFTLILQYNLDYQQFFESLYKLCQPVLFNAKYAPKLMKLLNMALRSTNLPVYLVAAFIKRLAYVALRVSAPRVPFCLAQITWLLRQHRVVQSLIHRSDTNVDVQYQPHQDDNLEQCGALQSSLWELETLERHYIADIAALATKLRDPLSTSVGATAIDVEQYIHWSFTELIDRDLANKKNEKTAGNKKTMSNAALAHRRPIGLLQGSAVMSGLFA